MIVISFVLLCILLYSFVVWCNKVMIKKDHFPFGGGHNIFCPNFISLPESQICFGNVWSDCVEETMEGEGVSPSHGGDFFGFLGTKACFLGGL